MVSPRIAIFPGSFDPLTNGHVDLIRRSTHLFDRVVVAVLVNPEKRSLFSVDERLTQIREVCQLLPESAQIEVDAFEGLLMHYALKREACAVVRGLRSGVDFEYERPMATMNAHLAPTVETVCLLADARYAHVSSRLIKEVASLGGSIDGLVPTSICERLLARVRAETATR
jgi:pantetheine-phosphate adenylyltransferase